MYASTTSRMHEYVGVRLAIISLLCQVAMAFANDEAPENKRKFRALVIAVSEYSPRLEKFPAAATEVEDRLRKWALRLGYKDENDILIQRIVDDEKVSWKTCGGNKDKPCRPSWEDIYEAITEIGKGGRPDDLFVLFFMGHGQMDDNKVYLLSTGWKGGSENKSHQMDANHLIQKVKSLNIGKTFVFFDVCKSVMKPGDAESCDASPNDTQSLKSSLIPKGTFSNLQAGKVAGLWSTTEGQSSYIDPDTGYGFFTKHWLKTMDQLTSLPANSSHNLMQFYGFTKQIGEDVQLEASKKCSRWVQIPSPILEGSNPPCLIPECELAPPEIVIDSISVADLRTARNPYETENWAAGRLLLTLPLTYRNQRSSGKVMMVNSITAQVELDGERYDFLWKNFVNQHEEQSGKWLAIEESTHPFHVPAGSLKYNEVLFTEQKNKDWQSFLAKLQASNKDTMLVNVRLGIDDDEYKLESEIDISRCRKIIKEKGKMPKAVVFPCR
jgi:Caspase domain